MDRDIIVMRKSGRHQLHVSPTYTKTCRMQRIAITSIIVCLCYVGCGGASQQDTANEVSVEDYESSTFSASAGPGEAEGLLGTVTEDEIQRVFNSNRRTMEQCYMDAIDDLEEIEGELRFEIEVASDGTVNSVFLASSDLGSVETETCMIKTVQQLTFSREPGGVAVIYYPMTLEAPYDHPPFVDLGDNKINEVVAAHREELDACIGAVGGIHLTLYIGTGGVVLSAGASSDTLDAYEAAVCAAKVTRSWVFPDSGSNIVKARIDL